MSGNVKNLGVSLFYESVKIMAPHIRCQDKTIHDLFYVKIVLLGKNSHA